MIQLENLTKKYGDKTVVDGLNLTLKPGIITGLLGPNGAGKSTTMKMIISLVHPSSGQALIDGEVYQNLSDPIKKIGTLIDPSPLDKNLTAGEHLRIIASSAGIDLDRVETMLNQTGLEKVKDDKVKTFSLGMKQRLGVATALISDPDVIILDEPFNGLDVDGIRWLRKTFRDLANEGKVVIVSSHLMSEIQAIADRVVIIGRGKLLADMTIEDMNEQSLSSYVFVKADDTKKLKSILKNNKGQIQQTEEGLQVRNLKAKEIGELAYAGGIILHYLQEVNPSLEDVFTEITDGKVEFTSEGGEADETSN